jgi:hypothetical protein
MDRPRPLRRAAVALVAVAGALLAWPGASSTAANVAGPPAEWTTLIDDTGLLSLAVPPSWDDVDTAPAEGDDGAPVPSIVASSDLAAMDRSATWPGVRYQAVPYDPDVGQRLAAVAPDGCAEERTALYDDGAFNGVIRNASGCTGGLEVEIATVVASPADRSLTVVLVASAPVGDPEVLDGLLAAFNLTPRPNPADTTATTLLPTTTTTSTIAAETTTTTIDAGGQVGPLTSTTVSSSTTTGPASGSVTILDDTGAISLAAPAAWDDVDPTPDFDGDQEIPYIEVSTDRSRFLAGDETHSVPGVLYRASPYIADTQAELATFNETNCSDGGIAQYADGVFTGHLRTYTECGGTAARMYLLMASPADHSFTAIVIVQLVETGAAADADLHTVLDSFNYDPAVMATYPFGETPAVPGGATTSTTPAPT